MTLSWCKEMMEGCCCPRAGLLPLPRSRKVVVASEVGGRAWTRHQRAGRTCRGTGIVGPAEGSGLLPWSWAEQRLVASRNYWVATSWPDGRPHAMPVWGLWDNGAFWFSSSRRSRKARNLANDPRLL
jgi:hypothetical protein